MKNLLLFLSLTATIFFTSCEGDQGPPGQDGVDFLGQVFEVTVDFNESNGYSRLITYPSNVVVYESDVVLVYLLTDVVTGNNGSIDVWSQLPQTFFPAQGTLLYTFDFTYLDVNLLLDANFPLGLLGPQYTDDQIFRIAIVPAEYASANLTMDDLLQSLQMDSTKIEKID